MSHFDPSLSLVSFDVSHGETLAHVPTVTLPATLSTDMCDTCDLMSWQLAQPSRTHTYMQRHASRVPAKLPPRGKRHFTLKPAR